MGTSSARCCLAPQLADPKDDHWCIGDTSLAATLLLSVACPAKLDEKRQNWRKVTDTSYVASGRARSQSRSSCRLYVDPVDVAILLRATTYCCCTASSGVTDLVEQVEQVTVDRAGESRYSVEPSPVWRAMQMAIQSLCDLVQACSHRTHASSSDEAATRPTDLKRRAPPGILCTQDARG
jgi:hypothetical protein